MVGVNVLILAIETATTAVAVALHDGVSVIAELTVAQGRRHAETLVPAIGFLCAQVQCSVNDVTAVAVVHDQAAGSARFICSGIVDAASADQKARDVVDRALRG